MTERHTPKRAAAGAPGAKLLITIAAVAATLGGWQAISALEPPAPAADNATATDSIALEIPQMPSQQPLRLNLGPIPTSAPPPPQPPALAVGDAPAIDIPVARRPAAPAAAPAAPVAVAAPAAAPAPEPAPVVVAQPAPALRAVSAPPKPVARTRSSK